VAASQSPGKSPAKVAFRDRLLTARNRRPLVDIGVAGRSIAEHLLATSDLRRAASVAAYVSLNGEPGTGPLLDALRAAGKRVLLPVLMADDDLDWAVYGGSRSLAPARRGLLQPTGEPLGRAAIATADVVLVPGLAVSPTGMRLGRGGGSYDRALGRVPVGTFTCVLLYDEEVGLEVPTEPHDRPVLAAATPSGVVRFSPRRGPARG